MEAEILPPQREPEVRDTEVRAPGWFGAVLALLTMGAAFGVGFLALFGKPLLAALLVTLLWPWIFSRPFTAWAFGTEHVVFWKVLLLFVAVDVIVRLFVGRKLWPRR